MTRPSGRAAMNRPFLFALAAAALLAGCGDRSERGQRDSLDAIARDYVLLSLTIGEKEEGYIDAYYGPAELQAAAKAEAPKHSLDQLAERVGKLRARASAMAEDGDAEGGRRAGRLVAGLAPAGPPV